MKKKLLIVSIIAAASALFAGCYYDKAELVYPPQTTCDTVNMSYSADIVPILGTNCYVCHGGTASGSAGRKFDTHPLLLSYANSGLLEKAVTHSPGATPMPYNLPKLPACTINKIVAWIHQGAKNN
jgi:hypothetical protein